MSAAQIRRVVVEFHGRAESIEFLGIKHRLFAAQRQSSRVQIGDAISPSARGFGVADDANDVGEFVAHRSFERIDSVMGRLDRGSGSTRQ